MCWVIKFNSKTERGEEMELKEVENKIDEVRYKMIEEIVGEIADSELIAEVSNQEVEQATLTTPRLEELKRKTAFREGYLSALTSVMYFINTREWIESE